VSAVAKNARTAPYIIPPGTKLKLLRDDIIVRALEWSPSISIVIAGSKRQTLRGIVTHVGPGAYRKGYNGPKGYRTKMWDTKNFIPTQVQPGDTVELGGFELDGYKFRELWIDNALHVQCTEADIVFVSDP
jgi:hypothetical protein